MAGPVPHASRDHGPRPGGPGVRRLALLWGAAFLSMVWFFPYQAHLNNPNENVRLYLTRAIVEHGTVAIGRRVLARGRVRDQGLVVGEWGWVNDKALVCDDPGERPPRCQGRLLAAKAPGTSLIGVPVYWALSKITHWGWSRAPSKRISLRVLRLTTVTLPWVAFALWFALWLERSLGLSRGLAHSAGVGMLLGSTATPYALLYASHTQVAMALGLALTLLPAREVGSGSSPRATARYLGVGAALGLAVLLEYPMALPAAAFGLTAVFVAERPWGALPAMALGALPMAAALFWYHQVALGSPFATPYGHLENVAFVRDSAPGFHGVSWPSLASLYHGLLSPATGLLFYVPAAAVAPVGLWWAGRSKGRARVVARAGLAALGAIVLLLASMPNLRKMLGWTVGPRYAAGVAAFVWVGVALWWSRVGATARSVVEGLAVYGVLVGGLAALWYPHYPMVFVNPTFQLLLPCMAKGLVPWSVGTWLGLSGLPSALPGLAGLAVAATWPWWRSSAGPARHRHLVRVVTLTLALGLASLPPGGTSKAAARTKVWVQEEWVPRPTR